jgi:PAS domain S-box-containing protein
MDHMQLRELRELVASTADAAFAVDSEGSVVAWNAAAEVLFGIAAKDALGKKCQSLVRGSDECGPVCSTDCLVHQAVRERRRLQNFDLLVETSQGKRWCNFSVMMASVINRELPFSIHVIRQIDMRKRLEILMRDFILSGTKIPADEAKDLITTTRTPAQSIDLSRREKDILELLAKGRGTRDISEQLHISRTTVNNHVQHIFRKLSAHTRLEAIRRAERAGLI